MSEFEIEITGITYTGEYIVDSDGLVYVEKVNSNGNEINDKHLLIIIAEALSIDDNYFDEIEDMRQDAEMDIYINKSDNYLDSLTDL
jgi:hypothetical protein